MNTQWAALKNNISSYRVPSNITAAIGGEYVRTLLGNLTITLTSHRTGGKATVTEPEGGWENKDLGVYFKKIYSAASPSPTRSIPTTTSTSSDPPKRKNTGAIVGGVVGGIIALLAAIAFGLCCLRKRRRQQQDSQTNTSVQPNHTNQSHVIPPGGNEKFAATTSAVPYPSVLQSSSPHSHSFSYSPQTSPPPPSWSERQTASTYFGDSPPIPQHTWVDWSQREQGMQIQYAGSQQYYPPPEDPMQSPSKYPHIADVELPAQHNEISEMPDVKSPVPRRAT